MQHDELKEFIDGITQMLWLPALLGGIALVGMLIVEGPTAYILGFFR